MVLVSLALGFYVSPYWYLLTAFVGVNLMQASVTGFCPAAMVFRKLGCKAGTASEKTIRYSRTQASRAERDAACHGYDHAFARCFPRPVAAGRPRAGGGRRLRRPAITVPDMKAVFGQVESRRSVPRARAHRRLDPRHQGREGQQVKEGEVVAIVVTTSSRSR